MMDITFADEISSKTSQFADAWTGTIADIDGCAALSGNSDECASCKVVTTGKGSIITGSFEISD